MSGFDSPEDSTGPGMPQSRDTEAKDQRRMHMFGDPEVLRKTRSWIVGETRHRKALGATGENKANRQGHKPKEEGENKMRI